MSDPRFARLRSDPRFRRPKKNKTKVQVDERFKSVFFAGEKTKTKGSGRVDKYGRPLSDTHERDNLRRFYHLEDDDERADQPKPVDYARGQVLLESSDEEDEAGPSNVADDSDDGGIVTLGGQGEDSDAGEINLDESEYAELSAQAATYSKENLEIEKSERTRRLAAVNLDWDHVRAAHIFKICSSLVSPTAPVVASSSHNPGSAFSRNSTTSQVRGQVLSVRVYFSEFGKERMAREEKEGPPSELFKKRKDSTEVNEKTIYDVGEENEVNEDALRTYQLERLRYYYAVIECDSVDAASHIYEELEGTELERSANIFNLSFIPDDMVFDAEFRDDATQEGNIHVKPLDFTTDALRHSKVKLTWDDDDPERQRVTRRRFSRKEIEEDNFKAYIASSSESETEERSAKTNLKAQSRDKLRALLLGGNDDNMPEGWNRGNSDDNISDVDMEVTFTPGLSVDKGDEDETTISKYKRKMKEKRQQRKEERTSKGKTKKIGDDEKDDFFDADTEDSESEKKAKSELSSTYDLAHLAGDDDDKKHFDLKAIFRAEKGKKGKGKGRKKRTGQDEADETQPDFAIDVTDSRFSVLHEDSNFAIDPSNPQFKRTKAMSTLLQEGGKRRQKQRGEVSTPVPSEKIERKLENLVESVKRKSLNHERRGKGKRQKLS